MANQFVRNIWGGALGCQEADDLLRAGPKLPLQRQKGEKIELRWIYEVTLVGCALFHACAELP